MKFTEMTEIYGDEQVVPNVGLGDYVAWTQQRFERCNHAKFGANIIWDKGTPRCRICRNLLAVAKRTKRNHSKASLSKKHKPAKIAINA